MRRPEVSEMFYRWTVGWFQNASSTLFFFLQRGHHSRFQTSISALRHPYCHCYTDCDSSGDNHTNCESDLMLFSLHSFFITEQNPKTKSDPSVGQ